MRLLGDDRGQAIQVGAVLLFGFLVVFLAIYQSQVVPSENKQIEAEHSDTVRTQLMELRNAILQGAATGQGYPVTVTLGTDYPPRIFGINPPPAIGDLETTANETVTLANATATDPEARDYIDGGDLNFTTKGFVYRPDYAEYSAPETVYGSTLLFTSTGSRFVDRLSGQSVVSGNTIRLVMVTGNLSLSGSQSATVEPAVVSGGTTITVENQTDPITITLPSNVSASRWAEILDSAQVRDVQDVPRGVKIVLEPGVYRLRLAKVTLGDAETPDPGPHYITVGEGGDTSIPENGTQKVEFIVRDRFNNPVTNATVTVSLSSQMTGDQLSSGTQSGQSVTVRTNAEGTVVVTYEAPSDVNCEGVATLSAEVSSLSGNLGTAETTVTVLNSDGSSGNGRCGGGGGPPGGAGGG